MTKRAAIRRFESDSNLAFLDALRLKIDHVPSAGAATPAAA
jgi:hypothetical protein